MARRPWLGDSGGSLVAYSLAALAMSGELVVAFSGVFVFYPMHSERAVLT
jgi:hypothetical protein